MNKGYNFTITVRCIETGHEEDIQLDYITTKDEILETFNEQAEDQDEVSDIEELEVSDWQDMPEFLQDLNTFEKYAEYAADSHIESEVWEAANYLGIEFDNVEEAYQGQYDNDESFAQDMAEQVGALQDGAAWPYTCIDWEHAARELMYDYCDHNGHYFRNL